MYQPPFKVQTKVSWPGEEEGDLGFLENEIIEVYEIVDEAWWSGKLRRNKAEGIFPMDYVEVIDQPMSHSGSNLLLNNQIASQQSLPLKMQTTPVKAEYYKGVPMASRTGTPTNGSYSRHQLPKVSYDYADDVENYSFDASFDEYRKLASRKSRSKMLSSINHPKYKHVLQQQQDEEREREMENFRQLKMQHEYMKKAKTQADPYKHDMYRHSASKLSKTKMQPFAEKSHSYSDIPRFETKQPAFQNHTVESFSPEHSPTAKSKQKRYSEAALDADYNEIALKRAQLEMELEHLKQLEKLTLVSQKKKLQRHEPSVDSSYVSEDILSRKGARSSRDDLGKKLSHEREYDHDLDDEYESPPPPPPPKHTKHDGRALYSVPFDADDFKFSGTSARLLTEEEIHRMSQMEQEELKNSLRSLQSDVLNLSELSATSAGSFMRHKYERDLRQQQELRMAQMTLQDDDERIEPNRMMGSNQPGPSNQSPPNQLTNSESNKQLMDSVFQDKKRNSNIFKKMLGKKGDDNVLEKKLQQQEDTDWATLKMELNRLNSLTSQDKQSRTKRIVREEGNLIVKPLDYISGINTNEVLGDIPDAEEEEQLDQEMFSLSDVMMKKIDTFMQNYDVTSDLNELISDVSVKFNTSKVAQLRCVLVHLCKFTIVEEAGRILQTKPKLSEVSTKGEATIYQINYLFSKILDALRIPSEVVLGFWKKPNEFYHNEQFVINHCWISVLINKRFFIMDTYCFKNGAVCNVRTHPRGYNEHYFLTRPLKVVSTHVPSVIDLQHVLPPIDQNVAFYLPRTYSGFYKSLLRIRNFNNALTRLKDLEFFEMELELPVDVELFALVKTAKVTTNELCLCQIFWSNNKRLARVKALLPEGKSIGVLQIFAGPKGMQKHFENVHELAISIPLYHTGTYKPTKFVPRFPTIQSQNNDLYVKSPQTSKIIVKNAYNFEVLQYPSMGLNSGLGLMNQDFKLVIESPSGKYFKLTNTDPSKPFGSYESHFKCQEVGLYRGLVIGDSGNSWYVFTQWECVAGISS